MKKGVKLPLFGDLWAVSKGDGTFEVRDSGGALAARCEYVAIELITPRSYSMVRKRGGRIDVLFSNLSWVTWGISAYALSPLASPAGLSVLVMYNDFGTLVMSDDGQHIVDMYGYRHVDAVADEGGRIYILVYEPDRLGPYVHVYSLGGAKLLEGMLDEVQKKLKAGIGRGSKIAYLL